MTVLPDFEGPKSFDRSTLMIRCLLQRSFQRFSFDELLVYLGSTVDGKEGYHDRVGPGRENTLILRVSENIEEEYRRGMLIICS
jgi:hypothetical protein